MSEYDIFPAVDTSSDIQKIGVRRTLTKFQPPEREFVEPDASDSFIHWLFRYRCIECKQRGTEVNEIVPRSRSKNSILDWKNRVLLCHSCHEKYHNNGVTAEKVQIMKEHRITFLKSFGREEYVTCE